MWFEERITVVADDTINFVDGVEMIWILDNRATINATSRETFTNYILGDFGVVKMENNDRAHIGRGDVHLEIENGTRLVLKFVRCAETLQLNIILVGLIHGD